MSATLTQSTRVFPDGPPGEPDQLYIIELKLRRLQNVLEQTVRRSRPSMRLRCMEKGTVREKQQRFRVDLRNMRLPANDGWYIVGSPTEDTGSYSVLQLGDVYSSFYDQVRDKHSDAQSVSASASRAGVQVQGYSTAMPNGVHDELSQDKGLLDSRFTKLSDEGSTQVTAIVIDNVACELLLIRECHRSTMPGTIGIVGVFPWSEDRLNKHDAEFSRPKQVTRWRHRQWTDLRPTKWILYLKGAVRLHKCDFV